MKEYKKILLSLTGFIFIFLLIDFCVGFFFDRMIDKMPPDGERVAKSYHSLTKVNADLVVIGSSRAETAYVSTMLMDSLNMSVYNCGGDGQDFFYCNTLINCILDRYTPKIIIWDFKERQLGGADDENLSLIYPYYWKNTYIRCVLDDHEGPMFKPLMLCNAYRYNATAGRILRSVYSPKKSAQNTLGFGPRPVKNTSVKIIPNDFEITDDGLSEKKVMCFIETVQRATKQGCQIYVVISPMFNDYNQDNFYTRETKKICEENGAVFLDYSHLEGFIHNTDFAYDNYHLNITGATLFTEKLIVELKEIIHNDSV